MTTSIQLRLAPGAEPVPGYRLVRERGRGGFGEVWEAVGPNGTALALKFMRLPAALAAPAVSFLGYLTEVRHPDLLPIFATWQLPGWLIISMELADCTLMERHAQALAQGAPGIPFAELIRYVQQAASGIDYLNDPQHLDPAEKGRPAVDAQGKEDFGFRLGSIQHRDIKPQNLFLVGGQVKVADFGLAKFTEHTVTGHSGAVTVAYAAPEFLEGQTTNRSDQYSLAVSYCQLRSGRLPFNGTPAQQVAGHLHRAPDLTMVPEPERAAVARALAKKPERRWGSCGEFADALRAAGGLPPVADVPAAHPPAAAAAARPSTRGWLYARLVLALVLAAIVVPAALILLWPESQPVQVQLETEPAGAAVALDGKDQDLKTPGAVALHAGKNELVLKLNGQQKKVLLIVKAERIDIHDPFDNSTPQIVARAGGKARETIKIALAESRGPGPQVAGTRKVLITSKPASAEVYIDSDGQMHGRTNGEFDVPNRPFKLKLVLAGYQSATREIDPRTLTSDKLAPIVLQKAAQVLPATRKLWISSDPADAEVYIDDDRMPGHTNRVFAVPNRPFRLKLVYAGWETRIQQIDPSRIDGDQLETIILVKVPQAVAESAIIKQMKFVKVPKGTFWMGWDSEKQQSKQVTIAEDFEIAAFTVTQGQWQAVMGDNPSSFSPGRGRQMGRDTDAFPVENISWDMVQAFLKKLNAQEAGRGWVYRLPTEAEWEYACRGAATSRKECCYDFYLGRPTNDLSSTQANFNGNFPAGKSAVGPFLERPAKVGSYTPNKLGLYDMHGNVWQWCSDLSDDGAGPGRVVRGGAMTSSGSDCCAAHRAVWAQQGRDYLVGFRLARVPSGTSAREDPQSNPWSPLNPLPNPSGPQGSVPKPPFQPILPNDHPDKPSKPPIPVPDRPARPPSPELPPISSKGSGGDGLQPPTPPSPLLPPSPQKGGQP